MLNSKRQLVVLTLCVLLSNKKSLEIAHVPKMELGIRNWTHQLTEVRKPQTDIPIPISNFFREPFIPI